MTELDAVRALADACGVEPGFEDTTGRWRTPDDDTLFALLEALGEPCGGPGEAAERLGARRAAHEARLVEPVVVAVAGRPLEVTVALGTEVALRDEDGSVTELAVTPDPLAGGRAVVRAGPLAVGVHGLEVRLGSRSASAVVLARPEQVPSFTAASRAWGVFAPLYALGPDPHYGDLAELGQWANRFGASVVATLPLLAAHLGEPSPYSPSSRRFWNERYVAAAPPGPTDPAELERFVHDHPEVAAFARFEAARELAAAGAVAGHDEVVERRAAAHVAAQLHATRQLGAVAASLRANGQRLYLDLPLGSHPDGWDVACSPELYAARVAAGAPPDDFFAGGQNWGFPPMLPAAARAEGHATWRAALAHHMRVAGVLRLDHVMQLERLYWVPNGFAATDGAYVRYPLDELLAAVAIEAHRHDCWVVGEDLGTVSPTVRGALADAGVAGMWVAPFEIGSWPGAELALPRPGQVASAGTHDTPTLAGWVGARDLELHADLGLRDPASLAAARADRAQQVTNLTGWLRARGRTVEERPHGPQAWADPDPVSLHAALLGELGASDAGLVLVTLEDLWGETEPQNVPGTPSDRPNWVQRLARPFADLPDDLVAPLRSLDAERRRSAGGMASATCEDGGA